VKIVQYLDGTGEGRVGELHGELLSALRLPDGLCSDDAVLALAMGDVPVLWDSTAVVPVDAITLLPPMQRPPSIRDFMLFEEHVANSLRRWNRPVPEQWYAEPAFYFTSPHSLSASGDAVLVPIGDVELDYELELGVVVGRELTDATPDEAAAAIAGFTLLNDFSLRDRQARERPLGLGPSKSKDFATALGPALVTPDDIPGTRRRPELVLEAWVNGELWSRGETSALHFDLGEAIAHASAGARVVPGDVFGSGTVPTGCIMELLALERPGARWLTPGDVVELKAEPLGTLRSLLVARPTREG
jgi:2-keto-4-pentenoate hydratase/2-oxohepta-3-ene-1,7-dioic acid hydratase in catechol pathway